MSELTISDYEEVLASHRQHVRRLDVIWNGEAGAAEQAALIDVIAQIEKELPALRDQLAASESNAIRQEQICGTYAHDIDVLAKHVECLSQKLAASEQALADSKEARSIQEKNMMDGLAAYEEQVLSLEQALTKCREEKAAATSTATDL